MKRLSRKGTLVAILLLALFLRPLTARAGVADMLTVLASIRAALNGAGRTLGAVRAMEARLSALEQQVVWPVAAIADVQASIRQARSTFAGLSQQIQGLAIDSATLGKTQTLEGLLRAPVSGTLSRFAPSYAAVYLPLPSSGQATEGQRNLMDMDDAFALESIKAASISDRAGAGALTIADRLEAQSAQAAPGSAGMLAAEAETSSLENQAMLQRLLAAQLRQEAALLAHRNALRKQSADSLEQLRNNLLHVLGGR